LLGDKSIISILDTYFPEVKILEFKNSEDSRGRFIKIYSKEVFSQLLQFTAIDVNISFNKARGTFRGFHFQESPYQETKIVFCLSGAILDIAIDVRPSSNTYLKSFSKILSQEDNAALLIPKGFAHGYLTLVDNSLVHYLSDQIYAPSSESGLNVFDPKLNFGTPYSIEHLSDKDSNWPFL
jgi:dTDP-4-dehydrorhamnose 3,5-epimerase